MDDSELYSTRDEHNIDMLPTEEGPFLRFVKSKKGNALLGLLTIVALVVLTLFVRHSQSQESEIVADPSSFTQTDLGDGWIRYERKDSPRFAISLPSNWNVTDVDVHKLQANMKAIDDPELKNFTQSESGKQMVECCLKLAADDNNKPIPASGFKTNIIVMVNIVSPNLNLEKRISDGAKEYHVPVMVNRINHKSGEAVVAKGDLGSTSPKNGEKITTSFTSYAFHKDKNYVEV